MTDVTKNLNIITKAQGAAAAAADLNKVAAATDKAASSNERLASSARGTVSAQIEAARSSLNLERSAAAQAARLDIAARAQQRYAKEVTAAGRFLASGVIDQGEYAKRLMLAEAQQHAMTRGLTGTGTAVGLTSNQMRLLTFQLNDVATMALSGSSAFQILATQGGQVFQIFQDSPGGGGGAFKAIRTSLTSLIGPMNATKAALLAIGAGGIAALGGLVLLKCAIDGAGEEMQKLVDIGSSAAKAGVSTSFFQQFTGQAKELGIEAQEAAGILEKLHEAGQVKLGTKGGPNQTGFQEVLGEQVTTGNVDARAAAGIQAAKSTVEQARLLSTLFDELLAKGARAAAGDIGEKLIGKDFANRLRDGVNQLDQLLAKKDALAAGGERIITSKEIANAARMKAELDAINNKLAVAMKPISEQIAAAHQNMLQGLIDAKSVWADIVGWAAKLLSLVETISNPLRIAQEEMKKVFGFSVGLPIPLGLPSFAPSQVENPYGPFIPEGRPLTVRPDTSKPLPKADKASSRAESTDQVESFIKSLQKLVAAGQAEALTLGLGNKAKQEAINLAKAEEAAAERGAALTQKECEQIISRTRALADAKSRIEEYAKAQDAAKAAGEFFGQTLEGAIERLALDGEGLKSVLLDIVRALEQAALKAVLLGEGPLGSIFGTAAKTGATGTGAIGGLLGSLLGALPKFAEGGELPFGRFGIVGERGPELIQGPAAITPFKQINAALDSGGVGRRGGHAVAMTIDVRGAQGNAEIQQMIASGVQAGMRSVHSKIARDIGPMTVAWNRRFG